MNALALRTTLKLYEAPCVPSSLTPSVFDQILQVLLVFSKKTLKNPVLIKRSRFASVALNSIELGACWSGIKLAEVC